MNKPTPEDLENRFTYHPAKDAAQEGAYIDVRSSVFAAARDIVAITPASREQSLALTKLEEAMFWANAAIARHG